VTAAPLARTMSFGAIGNTSFDVRAAAHTSSYCNRSGSMKIRSFFSNPKGGTPPLVYETCYRVTIISQLSHKPSIKTKLEKSVSSLIRKFL